MGVDPKGRRSDPSLTTNTRHVATTTKCNKCTGIQEYRDGMSNEELLQDPGRDQIEQASKRAN